MTSQLVDALFREATYRHRRNEFEHAEDSYRRVLALQPDHPDALSLLPLTLLERQTKTEDAAWGNRAIRKNPLNSLARINYGHHLRATDQTDRAETQFIFAQVINPADHDGIYNEAVALAERGEIVIAISRYRRALSIHPGSLLSKSNLSLALLTVGEYTEGWELYETRFNYAEFTSWSNFDFGYPKWNADSSLRGRRVVLWSEQGLGDTLQFCRFASLLIAAGAQVKLVASSSLHRILLTLHTAIEVFEAPPKDQDYHFPLMSLPRALGVTANQIPFGDTPYLKPLAEDILQWQKILKLTSRIPKIGLVWRAGSVSKIRGRSIEIRDLAMLSDSAMQFVALQKDVSLSELDFLAQNPFIITLDREQDDFADAAAIIANLDLVISVDTSVAHLAGALGKETWILLPKVCDWRWMVSRRDSPWYSSVRLFRQEIQGDWSSVVNEVKQELAERFSTSKVELK